MYWDGIWSAAHARAFEDHLPFSQLLLSLAAGVVLALLLQGRRRWVGVVYTAQRDGAVRGGAECGLAGIRV